MTYMPGTPARHPGGSPYGGRFAVNPRSEGIADLTVPEGREAYRVVDGACINCGHLDDHTYCEYCSPTCGECFEEMESVDQSLCNSCQERADEDDDPWE